MQTGEPHPRLARRPCDPGRRGRQVLGGELGVPVDHDARLPASQVLQLVAGGARLPMPGRPGMPEVMETEIVDPSLP